MNINIKATNTTLTPAIKQDIEKKLTALSKFLKPEHKLYVEVEVLKKHKSGLTQRVEVNIKPSNMYAEAVGADFYEALDLVVPKIKEQLVKNKDKALTSRRKNVRP